MLDERATGKITDVSPNFDRWVDSMAWSPDSKTIYFTAENAGDSPIYQINVTTANPGHRNWSRDSTTVRPDARWKDPRLRSDVGHRAE